MTPPVRRLPILALLLVLACSSSGGEEGAPAPERRPATLQVDNRNFLDMTVYVVNGGQRQRLGVARGNSTTSLTIPEPLIRGGASPLRFLCDPIGGEGLPVSEEIIVEPGDVVELVIPAS